MNIQVISKVPYTEGHSHFATWVKDFPQLHQHDDHHGHHDDHHKPIPQKEQILDHLRKELVDLAQDSKSIKQRLCYRSCFKLPLREYVEFCLSNKCGQSNFNDAARTLNLLK